MYIYFKMSLCILYFRTILVSQQNWAENEEASHILCPYMYMNSLPH